MAGLWLPLIIGVFAYVFSWPRRATPREWLLFDGAVLLLFTAICGGFLWRTLMRTTSDSDHLEMLQWLPLSVPLWSSVIGFPLLLVAAIVRHFLFRERTVAHGSPSS